MSGEEVTIPLRVPRSALTIVERAEAVTQRTSERVLGIPRRPFLALLGEYGRAGGEVISTGKLRLVRVEPFLRWLGARGAEVAADPSDERAELDAYAAGLGLVPTTRRRGRAA